MEHTLDHKTKFNNTQREDGNIFWRGSWRVYTSFIEMGGKRENIVWYNNWEGYLENKPTRKKKDYSKPALLYVVIDPRKPEWSKIGVAVKDGNRLGQYLASDPYREIRPVKLWEFNNSIEARNLETKIKQKYNDRSYEWFNVNHDILIERINNEISI